MNCASIFEAESSPVGSRHINNLSSERFAAVADPEHYGSDDRSWRRPQPFRRDGLAKFGGTYVVGL
jgi:hypothetical protein